MLEEKIKILGLKDDEVRTFLFLVENGPAIVGVLAKKLNVGRPSLYGYLKNLVALGLVTQSEKNGIKLFSPANLDKIEYVFNKKIQDLTSAKSNINNLFNDLKNKNGWQPPKFQIFEGKEEMRNLAKDFLLYKNTETQSYWPIKSMIEVLGEDFFRDFNIERINRNIWVDAIWPEKEKVDMKKYPFMGAGESFLREIRITPKDIEFTMGYWIYENKVAFLSSKKSNFGFIVENEEFANMLRSQFRIIWENSKALKVSDADSEKLFKLINKN